MKFQIIAAAAVAALSATVSFAETVLTVSGTDAAGQDVVLEYSMEDLLALEQTTISTLNNYVDDKTTFSGPLAKDVFQGIDLEATDTVKASAVNDYFVSIPAVDFLESPVILAVLRDGKPMSLRDKGPVWIIYQTEDYSDDTEPSVSMIHNRLIWQLSKMEVE